MSEFQSQFLSIDSFESKPLKGLKIGFIHEKLEEGVHSGVRSATKEAASDLEGLVLGKGILDKDYLAKPSLSYVIFPILSRVVFWKSAYAFVYILTSVVNINTSLQFTILSLLYMVSEQSILVDQS